MRRPVRAPLLPLVVTAAVLLAACGGSGDPSDTPVTDAFDENAETVGLNEPEGSEDARRVTVVGDSITALGSAELREALGETRLSITGVPGYRFAHFDLDALGAQDPDVVVIALGTNNILQDGWTNEDEDELADFLGRLDDEGPLGCTLFVDVASAGTVHVDGEELDHSFEDDAEVLNTLLEEAADERSEARDPTRVVHWSEVAVRPGVITEGDGIHPTAEGGAVWASLLAEEIDIGC